MVDFLRKRLQVFVSSTFNDLKLERQAAVEAILTAGHIPAGMELFGSEISNDQWLVNLLVDFGLTENLADIKGYKIWKKGNTNCWVPISPSDISFIDERSFEVLVRAKENNPYVFRIQTVTNEGVVSRGTKSNPAKAPT